jgi:hypothetical protein
MAERPTIRVFQYQEDPVGSQVDLATRFGEAVWVPAEWPAGHNPPEVLVLVVPDGGWGYDDYQLRSITEGELLVVHGHRRRPGNLGNLESGLLSLEGERFETLSRPADQSPHIVVRTPKWDVHVSGSVTVETALAVARSLVRVAD